MKSINELNVKIFADGADKDGMLEMYSKPFIQGFTTNPTLMKKAGIKNYPEFCKDILLSINDKPICFEIFSDEFDEMERQALEIASWGKNVYVKIPITNTRNEGSYNLIKKLVAQEVKLNITGLMTIEQVQNVAKAINPNVPSYISIFSGRIADTGIDPVPIILKSVEILKPNPAAEIIWASTRETYNIFQADSVGCHIITVTNNILNKLSLVGYDLDKFSLDTIKMFYRDAVAAGYKL
tara:strand:+ start:2974 stop:3690 length:717 start_codon:yes stop_codon:yes gene_type:complete